MRIPLHAKLWAVFIGLHLAASQNILSNLEIVTDSKEVIHLLLGRRSENHPLNSLILNCRCILSKIHNAKLLYVPRYQNCCADILAKDGRKKRLPVTIYHEVPEHLTHTLFKDKENIQRPP